jgi:hypothetical protein
MGLTEMSLKAKAADGSPEATVQAWVRTQVERGLDVPPERACELVVRLASGEADELSGRYTRCTTTSKSCWRGRRPFAAATPTSSDGAEARTRGGPARSSEGMNHNDAQTSTTTGSTIGRLRRRS